MATWTPRSNDEMDALRVRAADVLTSPASVSSTRSARDAARALVGVAGWLSRTTNAYAMQAAMRELASYEPAWDAESPLRAMPVVHGRVNEHVLLLACVAGSLVPFFGVAAIRSAMAFWATEDDSSVWMQVAA